MTIYTVCPKTSFQLGGVRFFDRVTLLSGCNSLLISPKVVRVIWVRSNIWTVSSFDLQTNSDCVRLVNSLCGRHSLGFHHQRLFIVWTH